MGSRWSFVFFFLDDDTWNRQRSHPLDEFTLCLFLHIAVTIVVPWSTTYGNHTLSSPHRKAAVHINGKNRAQRMVRFSGCSCRLLIKSHHHQWRGSPQLPKRSCAGRNFHNFHSFSNSPVKNHRCIRLNHREQQRRCRRQRCVRLLIISAINVLSFFHLQLNFIACNARTTGKTTTKEKRGKAMFKLNTIVVGIIGLSAAVVNSAMPPRPMRLELGIEEFVIMAPASRRSNKANTDDNTGDDNLAKDDLPDNAPVPVDAPRPHSQL